jgi:hypothetical protein
VIDGYTFNTIESCLWVGISIILFFKSVRDAREVQSTLRLLSVSFCLFGISDYIEARTGAWWTPFWLLLRKGGCIVIFILGFARYHKITKRSQP